ncbi:MAG: glycosyltransferase family 2 protein [Thermoanaerobaculales bacterium]|nr:glycosyltransferase family 2 protein [Thermoanaerobaculales bacterium]
MTESRPKITGLVTCFNEEHNIGPCIESLQWCDEIVVVDSFSTDRTAEIAKSFPKVRFFEREYYGAGAQKNWAMQHVRSEWVFLLDSDERCTPDLQKETIRLLEKGPEFLAYMMNRSVYLLGTRIRFSGWQRDRVARLFKRGTAYYENRRVHSLLHTTGHVPLLKHSIEHHMVDRTFTEYAFRLGKYGFWGAGQCWREGETAGAFDVAIRPLWRFFKTYVIQLGFLDGVRGLVFCLLQAHGTYMKFAILWGWRVNEARGIEPDLPEFDDGESTWEGLEGIQTPDNQDTQGSETPNNDA